MEIFVYGLTGAEVFGLTTCRHRIIFSVSENYNSDLVDMIVCNFGLHVESEFRVRTLGGESNI